jgi:hypothetical protein
VQVATHVEDAMPTAGASFENNDSLGPRASVTGLDSDGL